jgi:acyl-coenzyme A synthetase/AMP-(fatty) acid ligase
VLRLGIASASGCRTSRTSPSCTTGAAGGRRRRADESAAQGARGGVYLGDPEAKLFLAWHQFADAAHAGAEVAGAECVLVEPGNFESLIGRAEPRRDVVERAGDDTAVIVYTSGTTGRPKGAELTDGNLGSNTEAARGLLAATAASIALGALPPCSTPSDRRAGST